MTKTARGWYIHQGCLAIKLLLGEPAIVWIRDSKFYAQFDSLKLPTQFTHSQTLINKSAIVLEVYTTDNKITLEYLGKLYRRTVREGYFDFRGVKCKA